MNSMDRADTAVLDIDDVTAAAKREFQKLGMITTSTYMALNNLGYDAEAFVADFEAQKL